MGVGRGGGQINSTAEVHSRVIAFVTCQTVCLMEELQQGLIFSHLQPDISKGCHSESLRRVEINSYYPMTVRGHAASHYSQSIFQC